MTEIEQEKLHIKNLMAFVRRGYFKDLQGVEALALSRAYIWLDAKLKALDIKVVESDTKNSVQEETKSE